LARGFYIPTFILKVAPAISDWLMLALMAVPLDKISQVEEGI